MKLLNSHASVYVLMLQQMNQVPEEEEAEDEEMGVAETYADYMPAKCMYIYMYIYLYILLLYKNINGLC